MKHLNPRQGITTRTEDSIFPYSRPCETPKSPPGDYNQKLYRSMYQTASTIARVKHLNPRQGITTCGRTSGRLPQPRLCETPKSPPGDYNTPMPRKRSRFKQRPSCETPKSPPGDYNKFHLADQFVQPRLLRCETPKSPPGDYNSTCPKPSSAALSKCVKHLNPRQGITT